MLSQHAAEIGDACHTAWATWCLVPLQRGLSAMKKGPESFRPLPYGGREGQALTGSLTGLTGAVTGIVFTCGAPLAPAGRGMLISSTPLSYTALISLSLTPLGRETWRSKKP